MASELQAQAQWLSTSSPNRASDVLVRGVEVQLQLAAILLILTALPNLWYGLPETYRQRDKLFALLLARADWATSRPGAVGPGLPGPSGPGASAAQTGAPPAGAPAPASGAAPGAVPPQASGGPPGATAGAPPGLAPTAPAAPPIVLPEKDVGVVSLTTLTSILIKSLSAANRDQRPASIRI
ncbi:hypothetical protein EMMF5_001128 [Cystobasidiomycetes sp. EMM_F5]